MKELHRLIDERVGLRLPAAPLTRQVGTVVQLYDGVQTALVLLGGSATPVPVDYPALPVPLLAGDDVAVEAKRPGWLMITHVLGRSPALQTLLQTPVLATTLTPTLLAADVNDWSPAGGAGAYLWRVGGTAARNVTGMLAGQPNERREWVNVGSFTLTIKHDNASSVAPNRFYCAGSADASLTTNRGVVFTYDPVSARWRVGLLT